MSPEAPAAWPQVRIGRIWIDAVRTTQALDSIEALVRLGRGGSVFTPNVDHVVQAQSDDAFAEAYASASLSLADGVPLLWAARLLGTPLPEKVSGSDLMRPLFDRAVERKWRLYLLGGAEGVADAAAALLRSEGANVVGADGAIIPQRGGPGENDVLERIVAAAPDLLVVALGAPKQELFIHRNRRRLGKAVALGLGASLDFLTGHATRAPQWMQRNGLEWLYRLSREPRRLARRYLVDDLRFAPILLQMLRSPRSHRFRSHGNRHKENSANT